MTTAPRVAAAEPIAELSNMSKQVRWQVPFADIYNTRYRVDIYDEGYTGAPVILQAGETPFTTDEDDSDDLFAPIRTQSGTLQICTAIPGGGTLKLEDILPVNNIARPVRLLKLGTTNTVEWQGFLSCEVYSQDYIGIPQNLDLPVISVLEAMASVEVDPAKLSGLNTVGATINQLLEIFIDKAGVSYFSEYYVPTVARGRNIVTKYIDATVLFEQKEYNNENSTTYIVSGLSLQDCLARIATYMGWCLREKSGTLYFMAANETVSYNRRYRQGRVDMQGNFSYSWMVDLSDTAVSTQDIDNLDWMGNGHQRSVAQGAKSVEVIASLKKSQVHAGIPDFPPGNVVVTSKQLSLLNTATQRYLYAIISQNYLAYDSIQFMFYKGTSAYQNYNNEPTTDCYEGVSTFEEVLPTIFLNNPGRDLYTIPRYAGAFYIQIASEEEATEDPQYSNGIYLSFIPGLRKGTTVALDLAPIFKYTTPLSYSFQQGGTFKLEINAFEMMGSFGTQGYQQGIASAVSVLAHLRIGNNYWNGSGWVQSPTTFELSFEAETTISSVLAERMEGQIELAFYPHGGMSKMGTPIGPHGQIAYRWALYDEVVISKLDMSYEVDEDPNLTDRSENHYFRLLGTNFRDEISIDTDLASSLNNLPSPSLIMNDQTTPMTMLNYGSAQSPDMRRPEVDLLNRLAQYYSAARQRLELEVAHISTPLPLLKLNGINDGKVYLPMAESRDWRMGTCRLICMEIPS